VGGFRLDDVGYTELQRLWLRGGLPKSFLEQPKLYFVDSGIFHSLISVGRREELLTHPKLGASWEGFALECVVRSIGKRNEEFFFLEHPQRA